MISDKLKNIDLLNATPKWYRLYSNAIDLCDNDDIYGLKPLYELVRDVTFVLSHLGCPEINGVKNKYYDKFGPQCSQYSTLEEELNLLENAPKLLTPGARGSFLHIQTITEKLIKGEKQDKSILLESLKKHIKLFDKEIPNLVKVLNININTSSGHDEYSNDFDDKSFRSPDQPTIYDKHNIETPDVFLDPFDVAILSPCDGTIKNILISVDQKVYKRTLLFTIEKDDGTLVQVKAPCKGIIEEIYCYKNFIVRKGELLCVIDKRIPKGESLFDKYKELPRWKKILICIGIFLVIYLIAGMISAGIYSSKYLQEEKEAEEYSQYVETLRQELLEDTIPIDDYIPKAKKPKLIGNFVINDNECGIAGGSVYYISNGERVKSPYILYYKPTRIMLNDEAVDFLVNKLGPIFKDDYYFYSVIDINNMDTDNYDYIVIEVSIDDSKLVNEFPMDEYFCSYLGTALTQNDNKYHKTMNENYDYSYGHVSLIETHNPSIHVYPNYIFIKLEKGYNNYKLSYTCNGLYKDNDDYSFSNDFYGFFDINIPDLYNY